MHLMEWIGDKTRGIQFLLMAFCGDNCYSKRSNNPQDWPDGCTTLVPPSNNFLISIMYKINVGPDTKDYYETLLYDTLNTTA